MSDAISDGYESGWLFQLANNDGRHGMPAAALEGAGWRKMRESVRYPGSWLMRRDARTECA